MSMEIDTAIVALKKLFNASLLKVIIDSNSQSSSGFRKFKTGGCGMSECHLWRFSSFGNLCVSIVWSFWDVPKHES